MARIKKSIIILLAMAILIAIIPKSTFAVSSQELNDMQAFAEEINTANYCTNESLGEKLSKKIAEKYGYELFSADNYENALKFKYVYSSEEMCDYVLINGIKGFVTKDEIIGALKELYNNVSDDTIEVFFNMLTNGCVYLTTDGNYAVGYKYKSSETDSEYSYKGYKEENDGYHFYFSNNYGADDLVGLPYVVYNGKRYDNARYYYSSGDEFYNEVEYEGKTYICFFSEDPKNLDDGYYAIPTNEEDFKALLKLGHKFWMMNPYYGSDLFEYNNTYYYLHNGKYYPIKEEYLNEDALKEKELTEEYIEVDISYGGIISAGCTIYKNIDGTYYPCQKSSIDETEDILYDFPIDKPSIKIGEQLYFKLNGTYYALTDDMFGDELNEIYVDGRHYYFLEESSEFYAIPTDSSNKEVFNYFGDKLDLDSFESNGKVFVKELGSVYRSENGSTPGEELEFQERFTVEYDGKTYTCFNFSDHVIEVNTNQGAEIVLKLSDGKIQYVSNTYLEKFPEGIIENKEEELNPNTGTTESPQTDGGTVNNVSYSISKVSTTKYIKGNTQGLTITSEADFSKFVSVKVDGKIVDPKNYMVEKGSTKVTFKPEYLETLSSGKHTFTIVSTDGEATTTIEIDNGTGNNSTSPKTGSKVYLVYLLTLASLGALLLNFKMFVKNK